MNGEVQSFLLLLDLLICLVYRQGLCHIWCSRCGIDQNQIVSAHEYQHVFATIRLESKTSATTSIELRVLHHKECIDLVTAAHHNILLIPRNGGIREIAPDNHDPGFRCAKSCVPSSSML